MDEKWINQLMTIELFKDIEKKELNSVLSCLKSSIKAYKKRDIITIEKDKLTGIGVVLEGEVSVSKETLDGDRVMMSKVKRGDLFGEIDAFSKDGWLSTVEAYTDCTILFLHPDKIVGVCNKACEGHKNLIQNMLQIVAKKALSLNEKVEILSLKSIRKKISTYLIQQYSINNSLTFDIPLKRNELAEYILVSRPSLSRELINMKEEGIIDFHRSSFRIIDLKSLKECLG